MEEEKGNVVTVDATEETVPEETSQDPHDNRITREEICGEGYAKSKFSNGKWTTLKCGYLYKKRRAGEPWHKRWVILQVGRVIWTKFMEDSPKGASSMWYADIVKGPTEKNKDFLTKVKKSKKIVQNMSIVRMTAVRSNTCKDNDVDEKPEGPRRGDGIGLVDKKTGLKKQSRLSFSSQDLMGMIAADSQARNKHIQGLLEDDDEERDERETLSIPFVPDLRGLPTDSLLESPVIDSIVEKEGERETDSTSQEVQPQDAGAVASAIQETPSSDTGEHTPTSQEAQPHDADVATPAVEEAPSSDAGKTDVATSASPEAVHPGRGEEIAPEQEALSSKDASQKAPLEKSLSTESNNDQSMESDSQDPELKRFAKCLMSSREGDPASVKWHHEGMLWLRKEQDNSGNVLFELTTHWKLRHGRLCLWPGEDLTLGDSVGSNPASTGCPCLAVYRDKKWPSQVKQLINLKDAEVVAWDKSTYRTRLRFTITLVDGACYDMGTDKEAQRTDWLAAFSACGMKVVGKIPITDPAPPLPPADSIRATATSSIRTLKSYDSNEVSTILEDAEDDTVKEPENLYPLIIQFHTRDVKEHRRLLLAAGSPVEQKQWLKAFREASNPPDSSLDLCATSSNFKKAVSNGKGIGKTSSAFYVGGTSTHTGGGKKKAKPHWET